MAEPTLTIGAKGDAVHVLQGDLNKHGAKLTIDGVFGIRTLAAVRAFQQAEGITVDGIVGPVTWSDLIAKTVVNDPAYWMQWYLDNKALFSYAEVRPATIFTQRKPSP